MHLPTRETPLTIYVSINQVENELKELNFIYRDH